jgi:hypothetical protein
LRQGGQQFLRVIAAIAERLLFFALHRARADLIFIERVKWKAAEMW